MSVFSVLSITSRGKSTMFRSCFTNTTRTLLSRLQYVSGYRPILLPALQKSHQGQTVLLQPVQLTTLSSFANRSTVYPGITSLHNTNYVRMASMQVPNPAEIACNFINMAKCIDLNELKECPAPKFWMTVGGTATQLGIPLLELFGGYSPVLTFLQLHLAAIHLGFSGGEKWGLATSSQPTPKPTWETMYLAIVPVTFAIVGLSLPYPLGFLTLATGAIVNFYLDMKSCIFPPWQIASKFMLSLSSAIGLLMACAAYVMFANREASKRNDKEQDKAAADNERQDENGRDQRDENGRYQRDENGKDRRDENLRDRRDEKATDRKEEKPKGRRDE